MKLFLVLDPSCDPCKRKYQLNKSIITLQQPFQASLTFDNICFQNDHVTHNIVYDLVMDFSYQLVQNISIFFNNPNDRNAICTFLQSILNVKVFNQQQITYAYLQARQSEIHDRNKQPLRRQTMTLTIQSISDDPSSNNSKSNRKNSSKIKQSQLMQYDLCFLPLTDKKIQEYEKIKLNRFSNEILIVKIGQNLKLILANFCGQASKPDIKQVEQYLFLKKFKENIPNPIKGTFLKALLNLGIGSTSKQYFIAYYPNQSDHLRIPQRLINGTQQQVKAILASYQKQSTIMLNTQIQSIQSKIHFLTITKKKQEQKVNMIMSKYKKIISKIQDSICFLKNNSIENIQKHTEWLEKDIEKKRNIIQQQQEELRSINLNLIKTTQQQQYFIEKMQAHKQKIKNQSIQILRSNLKYTQSQLNQSSLDQSSNQYIKREVMKAKQKIYNQMQKRINQLEERKQFFKLLNKLKQKADRKVYTKIRQRYYDLINE